VGSVDRRSSLSGRKPPNSCGFFSVLSRRGKDRANAYLVGTPTNLRRPIAEEDAKTIIEN